LRAIIAEAPGAPEVLKLRDSPIPEPAAGQVRIRVAYADLNPLDTHARAKRIDWNAPTFPFTPGYEYSGLVEKVGEGVDASLLGKRVVSAGEWGGCAEYAVATAARVSEIPEGFSWQLGTVFQTCTYSAWHVLHTAGRLRAGDHVLLHSAAGGVAIMAAQIAKEAGATVYGTCSPQKMEFARGFGFDHLFDAKAGNFADEIKALTGGRGADLIVDGVAGPDAVKNYDALAPLGQVIYIGAWAGSAPPVDVSRQLFGKSIAVRGFVVYAARAATKGAELPEIHEALRSGRWRVPITGVFPLEETATLHARFENRELFGKTLIEVGGEL
jgi:NADPH2:quinone reductase